MTLNHAVSNLKNVIFNMLAIFLTIYLCRTSQVNIDALLFLPNL